MTIQTGGILGGLLVALPYAALKSGTLELIKDPTRYFVSKGINRLKKDFMSCKSLGKTLKSMEIKDIIKLIKPLENKGTATQITSQKGVFLILRPLMATGLPLMKSVLTPLGTSVLMSLGL